MRDLVTETFGEQGLLAEAISNYIERPQQVELSKKIQEAIKEESALLGEAPTGVGKSLAALVPAFDHIMKTDEPVIVATSSIILQEQYFSKDIPMLEKLYDFNSSAVLIKGRNNYLCPKKLNDAMNGKVGFGTSDKIEEYEEVMKWAIKTKSGDKSELDFNPSGVVWGKLACLDNNECTSKQCPFYKTCHYYRERKKVATSKLVVCNYHYFFSALDEATMLPEKARVLIMDEGHEVSTIARDFQERKYSMNTLRHRFDHFAKAMERAELSDIGESVYKLFADMELDQVNGTLTDMFVGLNHEYKRVVRGHYTRDFWQIEVPERTRLQKYATAHIEALQYASGAAENYLNRFGFSMETIPVIAEMYGEDSAEWFIVVCRLMELLEQKANLLEYIFHYMEDQNDGDDLFWLQPLLDSVSLHAKPTTGAGLTRRLFEKQEEGFIPIVMSATLSANQSFEHIKTDLGIEGDKKLFPVKEIIVNSPFDLENNLLWYLPPNTPAGNEKEHLSFALVEMEKVVRILDGRTLCLFTSKKNLLEAELYLSRVLPKSIKVISQEQWPKQKIIDYLKGNPSTVVLGTKSLFTGIDIQGQNLSAVLIDKMPYPMIGDPINDYLMSQPRGFFTFSLPEAIITMKQGFGRLNRTTADKGIVAIYDGRLSTAKYKNRIFNSFDFKIQATKNWDDLVAYVQTMPLKEELF
jgi:ATP-dependent DNA helicase DinG